MVRKIIEKTVQNAANDPLVSHSMGETHYFKHYFSQHVICHQFSSTLHEWTETQIHKKKN